MKYVVDVLRKKEALRKLPIIKMEIDYELMTLQDALVDQDKVQIIRTKERLKQLRLKLIEIE